MASQWKDLAGTASGGGGSGVSSFNTRTGAVTSASGDYSAAQVTNTPAGNIAATDVQAALNELDSEKQATITGGASSITTSNLTASRALASDGSGKVAVSATTSAELAFVNGVTSAIQTQLNNKQATGNYITALTGDVTASGPGSSAASLVATTNSTLTTLSALSLPGSQVTGNISGNAANVTASSNATLTTLSALSLPGSQVSGNISGNAANVTGTVAVANGGTNSTSALNNNRIMISSGGAIVEESAITANKALASNASGLPVASATTDTELGFVNGVTSAIQTQLNNRLLNASLFGNGADGAFSASSGTTSLARDQYYSSITLTGTAVLQTSGFRVYCSGTASVGSGTVLGRKANAGANSGGAGGATAAGTIGGSGSAGGAGGTAAGTSSSNASGSVGGTGGTGGTGTGGAGAAAGTLSIPNASQGGLEFFNSIKGFNDMIIPHTTTLHVGGVGGGGGGGDGTSGGGGGAGGALTWVAAFTLTGAGTIRAAGGDGGSPAAGNRGGGGAGGGGAIFVLSTNDTTGTSLTFDVSGGTGGTGSGTGTAGANGGTGNTYRMIT